MPQCEDPKQGLVQFRKFLQQITSPTFQTYSGKIQFCSCGEAAHEILKLMFLKLPRSVNLRDTDNYNVSCVVVRCRPGRKAKKKRTRYQHSK